MLITHSLSPEAEHQDDPLKTWLVLYGKTVHVATKYCKVRTHAPSAPWNCKCAVWNIQYFLMYSMVSYSNASAHSQCTCMHYVSNVHIYTMLSWVVFCFSALFCNQLAHVMSHVCCCFPYRTSHVFSGSSWCSASGESECVINMIHSRSNISYFFLQGCTRIGLNTSGFVLAPHPGPGVCDNL